MLNNVFNVKKKKIAETARLPGWEFPADKKLVRRAGLQPAIEIKWIAIEYSE